MNVLISVNVSMKNKKTLPLPVLIIPLSIMLAGQIFAKMSGNYIGSGGSFINIYSLISYICLISRGFVWIFIIRKMRLVYAYPLMSINYILVLFVSRIFFNERIISLNLIGAGLISLGVILIGFGEKYN
ncbi:MAG: hypothetical protein J7L71_03870, partial [Spirochaetaceae bacterium]|nr:hypothetical protein [Spirochaetaceae bacterium]